MRKTRYAQRWLGNVRRHARLGLLALATASLAGCETIVDGVVRSGGKGPGTATIAPAALANGSAAADAVPRSLPSCDGDSRCISVLTFNMRHRDVPLQLEAVASHLKADLPRLPDFILCQEVVFGRPAKRGHGDTASALADLLDYHVSGEDRRGGDEGVAIISRYPFDFAEHLHLRTRDAFLSAGFPRVSAMGEFIVPEIGRVRVVNVHLAQRRAASDIRREQLRETLEWMTARQREVPAEVIVFGGDFNIEPGWPEMEMVHDTSLNDGLVFADFNSRLPTAGPAGRPDRRVDYIFIAAPPTFADNASTPAGVGSVGEAILWDSGVPTLDGSMRFHPSDHLPIMHVFTIGRR